MFKRWSLVLFLVFSFMITGCDVVWKASESSTSESKTSMEGKAIDGYIRQATVLVRNKETREVVATVQTDDDGTFVFDKPDGIDVVVEISGGIDSFTGEKFKGVMKNIIEKNPTETKVNVTPLTSLVANLVESGEEVSDAQDIIANALDVDVKMLNNDPVEQLEKSDTTQAEKEQAAKMMKQIWTIQKLAETVSSVSDDSDKTHEVVFATIAKQLKANNQKLDTILDANNTEALIDNIADDQNISQLEKEKFNAVKSSAKSALELIGSIDTVALVEENNNSSQNSIIDTLKLQASAVEVVSIAMKTKLVEIKQATNTTEIKQKKEEVENIVKATVSQGGLESVIKLIEQVQKEDSTQNANKATISMEDIALTTYTDEAVEAAAQQYDTAIKAGSTTKEIIEEKKKDTQILENIQETVKKVVVQKYGSLKGMIYKDISGDGKFNGDETGIPNITIIVQDKLRKQEVVTNAQGYFNVDKVTVGDVDVKVNLLDADLPENIQSATANITYTVDVKENKTKTIDSIGLKVVGTKAIDPAAIATCLNPVSFTWAGSTVSGSTQTVWTDMINNKTKTVVIDDQDINVTFTLEDTDHKFNNVDSGTDAIFGEPYLTLYLGADNNKNKTSLHKGDTIKLTVKFSEDVVLDNWLFRDIDSGNQRNSESGWDWQDALKVTGYDSRNNQVPILVNLSNRTNLQIDNGWVRTQDSITTGGGTDTTDQKGHARFSSNKKAIRKLVVEYRSGKAIAQPTRSAVAASGFAFCKAPDTQAPILFNPVDATIEDSVDVTIMSKMGGNIWVDGIDIDKSIESNGKETITLSTEGAKGIKKFKIVVKDEKKETDPLTVSVYKVTSLQEVNVAQNIAVATAGSKDNYLEPEFLIDGRPSQFDTKAEEDTNWIQLAFPSDITISKIKVLDRHNDKTAKIYVLNAPYSTGDALDDSDKVGELVANKNDATIELATPKTGKYVVIKGDDSNAISMEELEVYSDSLTKDFIFENEITTLDVSSRHNITGDITYTLSGGDSDKLDINGSGVITLKNTPDYETKNKYAAVVTITNGEETLKKYITISIVNKNEAPKINFISNPLVIEKGVTYTDMASAYDDEDGEIGLSVSGSVDATTSGDYNLVYSAIDSDGNTVTESRVVKVIDNFSSEVLLNDFLYATAGTNEYGRDAKHVIDDDIETFNQTTFKERENWLQLELPLNVALTKIKVTRKDFSKVQKYGEYEQDVETLYLRSSGYGTTYKDKEEVVTLDDNFDEQTINLDPVRYGKYLIVQAKDYSRVVLSDMKIYGKIPASDVVEVNVTENTTFALDLTKEHNLDGTAFYSIAKADSDLFDVDEISGIVTFKKAPNFEENNSSKFIATITNGTEVLKKYVFINILDVNEAPVIDLHSADHIFVPKDSTFVDPVTAFDDEYNADLNLYGMLGIEGDVNSSKEGTYIIKYNVSDGENNVTKTRKVSVIEFADQAIDLPSEILHVTSGSKAAVNIQYSLNLLISDFNFPKDPNFILDHNGSTGFITSAIDKKADWIQVALPKSTMINQIKITTTDSFNDLEVYALNKPYNGNLDGATRIPTSDIVVTDDVLESYINGTITKSYGELYADYILIKADLAFLITKLDIKAWLPTVSVRAYKESIKFGSFMASGSKVLAVKGFDIDNGEITYDITTSPFSIDNNGVITNNITNIPVGNYDLNISILNGSKTLVTPLHIEVYSGEGSTKTLGDFGTKKTFFMDKRLYDNEKDRIRYVRDYYGTASFKNREYFPVVDTTTPDHKLGVVWQDNMFVGSGEGGIYLTWFDANGDITDTISLPRDPDHRLAAVTYDDSGHVYYFTIQDDNLPLVDKHNGYKYYTAAANKMIKVDNAGNVIKQNSYNTSYKNRGWDLVRFVNQATMRWSRGKINMFIAGEMYPENHDDMTGIRHQKGNNLLFDAETLDCYWRFTSAGHSMADYMNLDDNGNFLGVEIGDGSPRGFRVIVVSPENTAKDFETKSTLASTVVSTFKLVHKTRPSPVDDGGKEVYYVDYDTGITYYKWSNDNDSYAEIGGFEDLGDQYGYFLIQERDENGEVANSKYVGKKQYTKGSRIWRFEYTALTTPRNIGFVALSKDDLSIQTTGDINDEHTFFYDFNGHERPLESKGIRWLTDYSDPQKENATHIKTVKFVDKDNNTRVLILWEKWDAFDYLGTYYMIVDANGYKVKDVTLLSDGDIRLGVTDDPILFNNNVYLFDGERDTKSLNVIKIDIDKL